MLRLRFIPAYAGNARPTITGTRSGAVHPRIRGERGPLGCRIAPTSGSSPHTRGTLEVQLGNKHRPRFIPAYAGNAAVHLLLLDLMSVHPRIRGERCHPGRARHVGHGSSPHTRGTRIWRFSGGIDFRFIPAYAGNAFRVWPGTSDTPVHPRIRGERTSSKLLIYRMKSEPSDSTKRSGC